MIKYSLKCENNHNFEAWFPSGDAYDDQKTRGLLACPICPSVNIDKAPMAPNIAKPKTDNLPNVATNSETLIPPELRGLYAEVRDHIEKNFDYVGDNFAKEARDIHDGMSESRAIYGETTPKEAQELIEDGIEIAPIPPLANPKTDKGLN